MKITLRELRKLICENHRRSSVYREVAAYDFDNTLVHSSWKMIPIPEMMEKLRSDIDRLGVENVFILTARDASEPVRFFLDSHGIPQIRIYAVGNNWPQAKADVIRDEVLTRDVELVKFYDDLEENVEAVQALDDELPFAKIVAMQVDVIEL